MTRMLLAVPMGGVLSAAFLTVTIILPAAEHIVRALGQA